MNLFTPVAQTSADAKRYHQNQAEVSFQTFVTNFKIAYELFWNNPDYTPQEMVAAWDTEAVALFTKSGLTKDYIQAVDPSALEPKYLTTPVPFEAEIVNGAPTGRIVLL